MKQLSHKQEKFIKEYIINSNATRAAIHAGYSKRSAEVTGHRLLRNAKIHEAINKRKEELATDLRQKFIKDALIAREVMLEVLNNPNSSDRDKIIVAIDLLDRAGYTAFSKKEISGINQGEIKISFVQPSVL